jgi:hypothetical protein
VEEHIRENGKPTNELSGNFPFVGSEPVNELRSPEGDPQGERDPSTPIKTATTTEKVL